MANTYPAATLADIIASSELLVLQNKHLPLEKFSTDFSDEAVAVAGNGTGPRSAIKVDLVGSGSTVQTNPTNYESGDGSVTAVSVSMSEYSSAFHLTTAERNSGRKLEKLLMANVHGLLNKIDAVTTALFTVANYGTVVLDKDPTTVTTADIKTLIAASGKYNERNLITDTTFWAQFAVTTDKNSLGVIDGAYGLDSMRYISDWSNAGTNVNGIIADPAAVASAARLPLNDREVEEVIDLATFELPNGLTAQLAKWVSTASRNTWHSIDIVYGAAVGDASAGGIIEDGTA